MSHISLEKITNSIVEKKETEKNVSGDNWTMLGYLLPLNSAHSMNTAHVYTHNDKTG